MQADLLDTANPLRSDFGVTLGLPLVADRVRLLVQVEESGGPDAAQSHTGNKLCCVKAPER